MITLKKIVILVIIIFILFTYGCENKQEQINNKNKTNDKKIVTAVSDYSYNTMEKQISELNSKYDLINVNTIGTSFQKRKIYSLSLGNGKKKIAVIGGVHGREGLTSLLIMKMIEEYSNHYQKKQAITDYNLNTLLNEVTLLFIPMLNPDGIEIAINGIEKLDNKEFYISANENSNDYSRWKANARGVDLNKQFDADWKNTNSSSNPHYSDYKGPEVESEKESKALAEFTRKENFNSVICFHHSGRVIYWYYNQKDENLKRDKNLAKKIAAINGYSLVDPKDSDTQAAGYKDWFIKEFHKPGFTIEIGYEGKSEKPLPSNKLNFYFEENKNVILELAESL